VRVAVARLADALLVGEVRAQLDAVVAVVGPEGKTFWNAA